VAGLRRIKNQRLSRTVLVVYTANPMSDDIPDRQILTISQLNRRARLLLETHLPLLWLRGEISNLSRPGSGHWYLTLKDSEAQVRCAMFRNRNQLVRIKPKDGDQVLVRGRVGLYEARGDYQLIIEHMEADGVGLLQQRFDALKAKLLAEGLFESASKRPLPAYPVRIGVITSPTGAAIRDFLHVVQRRCPWLEIHIYPTPVQGREAIAGIVTALELANSHKTCDLLVLARGGGSLEDLWALNEEAVARAIYASEIPTVSAIGHETDFTIADFVADVRAPTPSAAAEIATPDGDALRAMFKNYQISLQRRIAQTLALRQHQLNNLAKRLRSPADQLRQQNQHLDHLDIRLYQAWQRFFSRQQMQVDQLTKRLAAIHPQKQLNANQLRTAELQQRLQRAMAVNLHNNQQQLHALAATLNAFSPLNTLERGYAIAWDGKGRVLRSATQVEAGEKIRLRVCDGELSAAVIEVGGK
jgi:exodeoxyribonuclease VII large subunit